MCSFFEHIATPHSSLCQTLSIFLIYFNQQPKVILSASVGIEPGRTINYKELLDKAIELSEFKPPSCVIYNREQVRVIYHLLKMETLTKKNNLLLSLSITI